MKNLKVIAVAVLALSFFSFTIAKDKQVKVDESTIVWTGKKVTGQHKGSIKLESGVLEFKGNDLSGGNFVIDMTTINVTDLEGKGKKSLEGHLKSDDFFGTEKHKKSDLKITKVSKLNDKTYDVSGKITIKGITKTTNFTMLVDGNTATTTLIIDRTKFGIKYGSNSFFDNLKDKAIYDEFTLDVNLKF